MQYVCKHCIPVTHTHTNTCMHIYIHFKEDGSYSKELFHLLKQPKQHQIHKTRHFHLKKPCSEDQTQQTLLFKTVKPVYTQTRLVRAKDFSAVSQHCCFNLQVTTNFPSAVIASPVTSAVCKFKECTSCPPGGTSSCWLGKRKISSLPLHCCRNACTSWKPWHHIENTKLEQSKVMHMYRKYHVSIIGTPANNTNKSCCFHRVVSSARVNTLPFTWSTTNIIFKHNTAIFAPHTRH